MTSWRVAIPSYGRANTCARLTIPLLLKRGVPGDRITVFCVPEQGNDYRRALVRTRVRLDAGAPVGMGAVRNYIARAYPPGSQILFADDDLADLRYRVNEKATEPVADMADLISTGFGLAGESLWGVYPVLNPYFMRPRVQRKLCYIVGCFYGLTLTGTAVDLVDFDDKEDFERSIKFYLHHGYVTRLGWVAPKTRYYTEPGGMQAVYGDRTGTAEAAVTRLCRRYPDLCKPNTRRRDHAEVVLRDTRFSESVRSKEPA